ncbi:MAG: hypothetical protein ACK5JL_06980 [Candidatus Kapaibacterium sp.]|jgi:hypothetical protein
MLVSLQAQPCSGIMLLQGGEQLESYGLDTTKNWWAKTLPYSGVQRLWVNGTQSDVYNEINAPVFSLDGEHWATWAVMNTQWFFIADGIAKKILCTRPGKIHFSAESQTPVISYFDGPQEYLRVHDRVFLSNQRRGDVYVSPSASNLAWVQGQEGAAQVVVNGKLIGTYEDVILFGFWNDGRLMFAAKSGTQWRWFLGEDEIAGPYAEIRECILNRAGTNAAAIVVQSGLCSVVLFSEEYTRPVLSRQYPNLDALVIHPTEPMWAARATQPGNDMVIMTGVEYVAGTQGTGRPFFSWDGKELIFFACDTDCFISINGRRTNVQLNVPLDVTIAREPSSSTYALSTLTSLVLRELERKDLWVSTMCEETSIPRYNRSKRRYEALGRINQRLYLLWCAK